MDRADRLIEIFEDTQRFYSTDPALVLAVAQSKLGTKFYDEEAVVTVPDGICKAGTVTVTMSRTYESAMRLAKAYPGKKIAVLNFASATNPGGGVLSGSGAQEESLCRCSTLYPTLDRRIMWQQYYMVNRAAGGVLHTDACIYSPGIVVCKTDTDYPERMPKGDWITVDVITCAAPNLRHAPANKFNPETGEHVTILPDDLRRVHEQRARKILSIAAENKTDILVLGAFGCGAFRNDPKVVAEAYANVLKDMKNLFEAIDFAIYCRDYETGNLDAFKAAMESIM